MLDSFARIIIVTGHYGSGKTNLSVNLALDFKSRGREVVLADLDIVNPYFRSADFRGLAEKKGIELITPAYAGSNVDIPSLTAALDAKIGSSATLIIDVGGDDAGAFALGRYSARLKERAYTMLYVVNAFRPLTEDPNQAVELLREIERASRLKATHIVNNSNLATETTAADILNSVSYGQKTAEACGLPLAFTAARRDIYHTLDQKQGYYPVDIYVKTIWN